MENDNCDECNCPAMNFYNRYKEQIEEFLKQPAKFLQQTLKSDKSRPRSASDKRRQGSSTEKKISRTFSSPILSPVKDSFTSSTQSETSAMKKLKIRSTIEEYSIPSDLHFSSSYKIEDQDITFQVYPVTISLKKEAQKVESEKNIGATQKKTEKCVQIKEEDLTKDQGTTPKSELSEVEKALRSISSSRPSSRRPGEKPTQDDITLTSSKPTLIGAGDILFPSKNTISSSRSGRTKILEDPKIIEKLDQYDLRSEGRMDQEIVDYHLVEAIYKRSSIRTGKSNSSSDLLFEKEMEKTSSVDMEEQIRTEILEKLSKNYIEDLKKLDQTWDMQKLKSAPPSMGQPKDKESFSPRSFPEKDSECSCYMRSDSEVLFGKKPKTKKEEKGAQQPKIPTKIFGPEKLPEIPEPTYSTATTQTSFEDKYRDKSQTTCLCPHVTTSIQTSQELTPEPSEIISCTSSICSCSLLKSEEELINQYLESVEEEQHEEIWIETTPVEWEPDCLKNAKNYWEAHKIQEVFHYLNSHLLINLPDDPVDFLINLLDMVLEYRECGCLNCVNPPLLFQQKHIESLFTSMDPLQNGFISLKKYNTGMFTLGIKNYNLSPALTEEGKVAKDVFVTEALLAMTSHLDEIIKTIKSESARATYTAVDETDTADDADVDAINAPVPDVTNEFSVNFMTPIQIEKNNMDNAIKTR